MRTDPEDIAPSPPGPPSTSSHGYAESLAHPATGSESQAAAELQYLRARTASIEAQAVALARTVHRLSVRNEILAHRSSTNRAVVSEPKHRLAQQNHEVKVLQSRLDQVLSSSSWRITRPLRFVSGLAQRLRSGASSTADILAKEERAARQREAFDEAYYLARYLDVTRSTLTPFQHYLKHGIPEGRKGHPADFRMTAHEPSLDSARPSLLIVNRVTSDDDQLLAMCFCEAFKDYRVLVLTVGRALSDGDTTACCAHIGPYHVDELDEISTRRIIAEIKMRFDPEFVIINGVLPDGIVRPLAQSRLPSVLLLRSLPDEELPDLDIMLSLAWGGRVVFLSELVKDCMSFEKISSAVAASISLAPMHLAVRLSPAEPGTNANASLLRALLSERRSKTFLVLGAGPLEFGQGADLFVATARALQRIDPDSRVLMVWIETGNASTSPFSSVLRRHLKLTRHDNLEIIHGDAVLDEALAMAGAFFVASRLEPLSTTAIGAMSAGVPILCFEDSCEGTDFLLDSAIARDCVIPLMDVKQAALQLQRMARDEDYREALADTMQRHALTAFDVSLRAGELKLIAKEERQRLDQVIHDAARLSARPEFDLHFYRAPAVTLSQEDAVFEFVKLTQNRLFLRKPRPGFYANLYAAGNPSLGRWENSFLHYLENGNPKGAWQISIIDVSSAPPVSANDLRIAIHIHVFYGELLAPMLDTLNKTETMFDLFLSVPSDAIGEQILAATAGKIRGTTTVRTVPNRGRDIGPMLTEFAGELRNYDVVGHFHTKKSVHLAGSQTIRDWISFLTENLLGGTFNSAARILAEFAAKPHLGMVFADDPYMIGWDQNLPYAEELADRLRLPELPQIAFPFPVGTMFWCRPAALERLFDLKLSWADYPSEPLPTDGTMLHAIERLTALVALESGFDVSGTHAPGISR